MCCIADPAQQSTEIYDHRKLWPHDHTFFFWWVKMSGNNAKDTVVPCETRTSELHCARWHKKQVLISKLVPAEDKNQGRDTISL